MTIGAKECEIADHLTEVKKIEEEIQTIKDKKRVVLNALNESEREFLRLIPQRIKEGYKIGAFMRSYNNRFGKDLSKDEFAELVIEVNKDVN